MIQKPQDWESAQAFTGEERQALTPGGHIVRIAAMRQEMSRNNKPMITVMFDIDEGSEFDGFYKRLHENKKKFDANAKWQGVIRFMLYNKDGGTNGFFKGFIGALEESNPGFKWNWDERSVANKFVGIVFGEEEYRKTDGTIGTNVRAQMARSVQAVRDGVEVPKKRTLPEETQTYAPFDPNAGFTQVEDKLPWEM
jgi:hypothetical protein